MTDHARFDALADLPFKNELERILVQQELSAPQRVRRSAATSCAARREPWAPKCAVT